MASQTRAECIMVSHNASDQSLLERGREKENLHSCIWQNMSK